MSKNHYFDSEFYETIVNMDGLREQIGKLVFAECREDGDTRMFLMDGDLYEQYKNKSGWWKVFTITEKPCSKGIFICEIKDLRQDKNGNPMFIVNVGGEVSRALLSRRLFDFSKPFNYATLYLLKKSGLFSNEIEISSFPERYNLPALGQAIGKEQNIEREATMMLYRGEISWEDIAKHLDTLYYNEQQAFDLFRNIDSLKDKYPLLAKRVYNHEMAGWNTYYDEMGTFLEDYIFKYNKLAREGKITEDYNHPYDKAEALIRYYDELHKAQKAAKKAAKKAKKEA